MHRNLFVVMRLCAPVVLSYLDARFEARCGRKDFWTACCLLLLLAKTCCSPLDPKRGCKTSIEYIKTRTRTELGPSLS